METSTAATQALTVDAASTVGAGEEFARLAPTALEVGPNVRDEVDTDSAQFRALVDSIAMHGVLQALSAIRDGQDIVVLDGQQRALAAIEAGAETVPVVIRTVSGSAKAREIDRLSQQVVANDRRIDLTAGQRTKAVAAMLDLGVSVTKISKAVQMDREQVKTATAAGRSQTALDALDSGQFDLEQASIIATFDADGDEEAVNTLLESRYNFRYTAQRLLGDRAEKKARTTAGALYAERGFTVLDTEPAYRGEYFRAEDLVTIDGGTEVTAEFINAAPTHWAVWLTTAEQITITATGDVITDEQIDYATENDADAEAEKEYYHYNDVTFADVWVPEYFTYDAEAAGTAPNAVLAAALSIPDDDESNDPEAAARARAREKAAAAAELAHKERQRAERRRTVALNKASAAATIVRKEWLAKFLTRKTLPKGAAKWITDTLVDEPALLTQNQAPQYLAELLSVTVPAATGHDGGYPGVADRTARGALAAVIDKASDTRAQVLLLAQILAAYEARMSGKGNDSWRRTAWGNLDNFLGFLDEHGHTLMPVEQAAAGTLTPDQAHTAITEDGGTD
ncbi:hypothetical protein BJI47_23225 [Rhodococcus sp. 1168]|nr:ParB N-terminal domain-containing protein [Rhodococcus sp. 1168]ORI13537.1 hypothetical protein BJI47_23225 [Rhodococcus sp. 1168]